MENRTEVEKTDAYSIPEEYTSTGSLQLLKLRKADEFALLRSQNVRQSTRVALREESGRMLSRFWNGQWNSYYMELRGSTCLLFFEEMGSWNGREENNTGGSTDPEEPDTNRTSKETRKPRRGDERQPPTPNTNTAYNTNNTTIPANSIFGSSLSTYNKESPAQGNSTKSSTTKLRFFNNNNVTATNSTLKGAENNSGVQEGNAANLPASLLAIGLNEKRSSSVATAPVNPTYNLGGTNPSIGSYEFDASSNLTAHATRSKMTALRSPTRRSVTTLGRKAYPVLHSSRSSTAFASDVAESRVRSASMNGLKDLMRAQDEALAGLFSVVGCFVKRKRSDVLKLKKGTTVAVLLKFESSAICDQWEESFKIIANSQHVGLSDYKVISPIGQGASAKVFLVSEVETGNRRALKIMHKNAVYSNSLSYRHAIDERLALETIRDHPNFVHLQFAFQSRQALYFVSDFYVGGDLQQFMARGNKLNVSSAQLLAARLILCLEHLHTKGFLYRDLKPENILIDENGCVFLADLGECKRLLLHGKLTKTKSICGTLSYAAPEMLAGLEYGFSIDYWSLGVLLFHVVDGKLPFSSDEIHLMSKELEANSVRSPSKHNITEPKELSSLTLTFSTEQDPSFVNLVTTLLHPDPEKRLGSSDDGQGAPELKNHSFFQGIDWKAIISSNCTGIPALKTYVAARGTNDELRNFDLHAWKHLQLDEDEEDTSYGDISLWPPSKARMKLRAEPFIAGFDFSPFDSSST